MNGFTDIHAHFLYGIDDGAQTKQDMMDMLDAANRDGIGNLIATSHRMPGVRPFPEEAYEQRLMEARQYCKACSYPITIHSGAEILYTPAIRHEAQEHQLKTLADTEYILVEFVPDIAYKEMDEALQFLEDCGYMTIVAHIERYRCLRGMGAYRLKKSHRIYYQMNANTILKQQRFYKAYIIRRWLRDGLIDFVASDSHNCTSRSTKMKKAYEELVQIVGEKEAHRLACC